MRAEAGLLLLVCWGGLLAAPPQKKKDRAAEGYAGTEACVACHEEQGKGYAKTRHGALERETGQGWKDYSCEACHGPGQKHGEVAEAKFIVNHAKATPKEADASCLGCHKNQATHAGRVHGSHSAGQVGCGSCHGVHQEKPHAAATCGGCHTDVVAQFLRPHAHRITRGTVECVDCHNPHGSLERAGLRGTARTRNNEPGCLNCHADKRGPFAFEHAPMRLEGCGSCHEPHGSANPRMLNRAEVMNLCLECHANLPAPGNRTGTLGAVAPGTHDLRLPLYRNCTTCHTKIHGSHVNRDFLR